MHLNYHLHLRSIQNCSANYFCNINYCAIVSFGQRFVSTDVLYFKLKFLLQDNLVSRLKVPKNDAAVLVVCASVTSAVRFLFSNCSSILLFEAVTLTGDF